MEVDNYNDDSNEEEHGDGKADDDDEDERDETQRRFHTLSASPPPSLSLSPSLFPHFRAFFAEGEFIIYSSIFHNNMNINILKYTIFSLSL